MQNAQRPSTIKFKHEMQNETVGASQTSPSSPSAGHSMGSGEMELARRYEEQMSELSKVREFNAELLERLAEVRKRRSDGEADSKVREVQQMMEAMKEDFNRSFTRLTDDNWAKDLEIRRLLSVNAEAQARLEKMQQEGARHLREVQSTQGAEFEQVKESNAKLSNQLLRLESERTLLQTQLTEINQNFDDLERAYFDKDAEMQRARSQQQQAIDEIRAQHDQAIQTEQSAAVEQAAAIGNLVAKISQLQENLEEAKAAHDETDKTLSFERRVKEELGQKLVALEQRHNADLGRIHELEFKCNEQTKQIHHVNDLLAAFEGEIQSSKTELQRALDLNVQHLREVHAQHALEVESLRKQEAHANAKIAALRTERLAIEKRVKEANDVASELRGVLERQKSERESEYRYLEMKATRNIAEIQSRIELEATKTIESLQSEIDGLKSSLEKREGENAHAQSRMDQWRQQLDQREMNCLTATEWLTKSKTEILRLSQTLAEELRQSRETHPLRDYLQISERELKKLHLQLSAATPAERPKLEAYIGQMTKEFEFLKSVLTTSQRQAEERSQMIASILQSEELRDVTR